MNPATKAINPKNDNLFENFFWFEVEVSSTPPVCAVENSVKCVIL